jgi:hypothetical protein
MVSTPALSRRSRRRQRPSSSRRIVLWGSLGLLAIIVLCTAWVGVRGYLAKGELESAVPLASSIQSQILAADGDAAAQSVEELQKHSANAASLTSDPIWRAYEVLPWLGPNLMAVRELAGVVDDVAQGAVGPLAAVATTVDLQAFKPVDGAINLQPLVDAQGDVALASTALTAATTRASAIDTTQTLNVIADAAVQLQTTVATTDTAVDALNRAVQLLPSMLGAEGPRNYVLMFQNPAELRATGGIAGALALVHTEGGRIELAQQANSGDFPRFDAPVLPLTDETRGIYGDITGTFIQNVNLTPNFTTSGPLAAEMWRLQFGVEVDGVISLDPVTLSYLLAATGPITLPTGDVLSAENVVQLLLVDAYARYDDPADQDAFFAAAAASVFEAVAGGGADPVNLIDALARAGDEHRVLVYSAHEAEQAVLLDTTIAGTLPVSTDAVKRLGVYFNDGTGSKMNTYLDVKYAVGQVTCRNDQRPEFGLDVTLTNTAPADAATSLPKYVTGGGGFGITPGNIKTLVSAYGSPDMQNLGVLRDDADVPYHPATDATYPVSTIAVELAPGESTVLSFDWLGAEPFDGDLEVQSTPLIHLPETETLDFSC